VLLLVLILVLIAFSLLVVALLSGSVLWAWVSVGVSVAAAAVLLIDYLQRRSAVKAGAQAGAVSAPPSTGSAEVEPVTEVLPVIPRSGAPAAGDEAVNGSQQDAATALFDQRADAQQTVVMPVVQPSASTDRPSGASHGTTSSGGDLSPTVTTGGPSRSPSGPPAGDADETPAAPEGGQGSAAAAALESPAREKPGADATVAVHGKGTASEAAAPAQEPSAEEAGAASATSAAGTPGEAAGESEGAAADGDPPEEPHDPAAAAVVAGLETEVLVIDEQPRYHVPGCRSLVGRPLIPLPAREAVELGFTPCGWCSPDRTLAAQHAAAR
jgi:hypothetical protein